MEAIYDIFESSVNKIYRASDVFLKLLKLPKALEFMSTTNNYWFSSNKM